MVTMEDQAVKYSKARVKFGIGREVISAYLA